MTANQAASARGARQKGQRRIEDRRKRGVFELQVSVGRPVQGLSRPDPAAGLETDAEIGHVLVHLQDVGGDQKRSHDDGDGRQGLVHGRLRSLHETRPTLAQTTAASQPGNGPKLTDLPHFC